MELEEADAVAVGEARTRRGDGPEDNDSGIELMIELADTVNDEDYQESATLAHTRGCAGSEGVSVIVHSVYDVEEARKETE